MPSARELLEQADALMRKNRKRGDGDIPMLTDAVEVAIIPVAIPAAPTAPATPAAPAAQPVRTPSPVLVAAPPPADVPLLTDAVDDVVIEFGPLPAPPAALGAFMEGDPSDWLVMDTIDPASHSITGRGPDTLAVVPPMTLKAAGSAATPPPMGSQPREWPVAPVELLPQIPHATSDQQPVPNLPAVTVLAPPEHSPAATVDALEETAAPATVDAPATTPEALAPEAAAHTPAESVRAEAVQAPAESTQAEAVQAPEESVWPEAVQAPRESSPEAAVHAPAPELPEARVSAFTELAPVAIDEEHWRALAEQISMQVLQRLDLFTDSGLKEQLARRLEPIVARASAELVGEITEHVGRLVRTYVSEAIEREIAQWKRDQH
jgi:hypothetical protein